VKNEEDVGKKTNKSAEEPEISSDALSRIPRTRPSCYTGSMVNDLEFRSLAETALSALKQHLIAREAEAGAGFEVEEQNGVLNVEFEQPAGKFVITPNAPVRQIWISALSTSFKLDWDEAMSEFILPRTGEELTPLVDRLIEQHLEG